MVPDNLRAWLAERSVPMRGTVGPDGRPQIFVVWAKAGADEILMSTTEGRPKLRNLRANPFATLLVQAPGDAYDYVQVRGPVRFTTDDPLPLIDELCRHYRGQPWVEPPDLGRRVTVHLHDLEVVPR